MHLKILKADLILVKSHRKFVDLEKKWNQFNIEHDFRKCIWSLAFWAHSDCFPTRSCAPGACVDYDSDNQEWKQSETIDSRLNHFYFHIFFFSKTKSIRCCRKRIQCRYFDNFENNSSQSENTSIMIGIHKKFFKNDKHAKP
jgi:hypothetical protein